MAKKQDNGHIDSAKYVVGKKGEALSFHFLEERFPHLVFDGDIQTTGLLGRNPDTGDFEIFVRHPWWIPVKKANGHLMYGAGGTQTEDHIIHLMGRSYGVRAQSIASDVITALKNGEQIPYGALTIGKEQESIAHNAQTGCIEALPKEEQFEFQAGVHEDALPPYQTFHEAIHARIQQIQKREKDHPGLLLMDTSAPLVGSPQDPGMQLNNGAGGSYIRPWSECFLQKHVNFSDSRSVAILNDIAKAYGYTSYKELIQEQGFQVIWPTAASQISIGMPHVGNSKDGYTIPLEITIATADLFNSHVGIIAELLTASSPMVFGIAPRAKRDYRMALRYLFPSALPAACISTISTLRKRWQEGGMNGLMYTLDRLSFQVARKKEGPHPMFYGGARVRVETKDVTAQLGRVENTIAGSTPSLLDEVARDAFSYLLAVAAHEAIAEGKTVRTYFGKSFKHMYSWRGRKKITDAFITDGARHPLVADVIEESVALLKQMRKKYVPLRPMIDFVIARIRNLHESPQKDLRAYEVNPKGMISEVMMQMLDNGTSPLELLKEACRYQKQVAEEIASFTQDEQLFERLLDRYVKNKKKA